MRGAPRRRRDGGPRFPDGKLRGAERPGTAPAWPAAPAGAQEVWPVHATHLTEGPVRPEGRKTGTERPNFSSHCCAPVRRPNLSRRIME